MTIRQLRYFLRIIELKSFSKAAAYLHVAQPALGLQIRKLEEELGVKLLNRHSRGITPTEASCRSDTSRSMAQGLNSMLTPGIRGGCEQTTRRVMWNRD